MKSYGYVSGIAFHRAKGSMMEMVDQAFVTAERGIVGDFRGGGGRGKSRQVTVLFLDGWQEACSELQRNIVWPERRANVLVSASLEEAPGPWLIERKIVFSSGMILQITGELKPCGRMDEVYPGLQAALAKDWRGGVACQVRREGMLSLWDTFCVAEKKEQSTSLRLV